MNQDNRKIPKDLLNNLRKNTGSKSISEASGLEMEWSSLREAKLKELNTLLDSPKFQTTDHRDAEIELSYINAAITLAKGSNDIGAQIQIGPFTIGVSLNSALIPILEGEASEIEKYLRGEQNNYE